MGGGLKMCRLLGIVASEPTEFRIILRESPRSLAALSREHRDGWGLAVFDPLDAPGVHGCGGWRVHKAAACAAEDGDFGRFAAGRGALMIWHVRRRTVGAAAIDNTHPFQKGRWVFAHNGTIRECDYLRALTSPRRLAEVRGKTDSELFFAYLLSELDEANAADVPASPVTDAAIAGAVRRVCANPRFGTLNFLLSDGVTMYAHRFGRTLFLLERAPRDEIMPSRRSRDGTLVVTPWTQRCRVVFVASEAMTDEPWREVEEGTLLRIDRLPAPTCRVLLSESFRPTGSEQLTP
jgi:glutamine amidotransferase